jgi:hypothetical protein
MHLLVIISINKNIWIYNGNSFNPLSIPSMLIDFVVVFSQDKHKYSDKLS